MKSANVFLSHTRDGTIAKLGDFNVSKVLYVYDALDKHSIKKAI